MVVVDDRISFDDDLTIFWLDWETVELQSVVDHQKWVLVLQNIVIKTHTIEILLQERFEHRIVPLQRLFVLADGQFVQKHLVVPLVEVIQIGVLVVVFFFEEVELGFHFDWNLVDGDRGLIERQNFLPLRLELPAELGSPQDSLAHGHVVLESVDGGSRVHDHLFETIEFLVTEGVHLLLEGVVVPIHMNELLRQQIIHLLILKMMLPNPLLLIPNPRPISLNAPSNAINESRLLLVLLVVGFVRRSLLGGLGHVTLMDRLEVVVQPTLHGFELHSHVGHVLHILVTNFFLERQKFVPELLLFRFLIFLDGLQKVFQLAQLFLVILLNLLFLP